MTRVGLAAALALLAACAPAPSWPPPLAEESQRADLILVEKSKRRMTLLRHEQPLASFDIALGDQPVGHKLRAGDERTPEGQYRIDYRNDRSRYHLSLRISYPTPEQRAAAQAEGRDPGGDIVIHGRGPFPQLAAGADWTDGCIAVSNEEMERVWPPVALDTPIRILP